LIRDLAYLFLQSRRDPGFSTLGKVVYSITLVVLLVFSRSISSPALYYSYPAMILLAELAVSSMLKGFRPVLNGLKLVALFTLVGIAFSYLATLMNAPAPSLPEALVGGVRLVAFFLAFTLLFQLLTVGEWEGILARMGLGSQAVALALTLSQLPLTLLYFSEALTTVSLKYRGKSRVSFITPLVYHTALSTRSRLEALLQYPIKPLHGELALYRSRDLYLYALLALLSIPLLTQAMLH